MIDDDHRPILEYGLFGAALSGGRAGGWTGNRAGNQVLLTGGGFVEQ